MMVLEEVHALVRALRERIDGTRDETLQKLEVIFARAAQRQTDLLRQLIQEIQTMKDEIKRLRKD